MSDVANAMKVVWGRRGFFLDLGLLPERLLIQDSHPWFAFGDAITNRDLLAIPVVRARDSGDKLHGIRNLALDGKRGICLRLDEMDLLRPSLTAELHNLFEFLTLHPRGADLIVDLAEYCDTSMSYQEVCDRVPAISAWRSFTICSGAFCKDLSAEYKAGKVYHRRRRDWLSWESQTANGSLKRVPSFGDYTVQFGRYVPNPDGGRPSASVRYTLEETWMILRGEWPGKEKGPGTKQYNMWAKLLIRDAAFSGADFSAGDAFVAEKARDTTRSGGPKEWLYAAINHHITLTARQLASRSGS